MICLPDSEVAQAKKENVPKEYLKRQQNLEAEVNSLKEERTRLFIERQINDFRQSNPDVKDVELAEALRFMGKAHRLGEESITLDQAFRATNPNYETSLRERIRQEVLAEMAKGQAPLVTKGTAPNPNTNRTADDLSDDEFDKLIASVKEGKRITKL